jgi:hypothetical protein
LDVVAEYSNGSIVFTASGSEEISIGSRPIRHSHRLPTHRSANILPSWVLMPVHEQLRFQCGKEGVDDRIVSAMVLAAYGALDAAGRQPLLIRHRLILTATNRMMEEADRYGALLKRHLDKTGEEAF